MTNIPASSDNLFASIKSKAAEAANTPVVQTTVAPATESAVVVPVAPVVPVVEEDEEIQPPAPTELDMLKNRARLMGIEFSNNIGLPSLKAKIQAKLDGDTAAAKEQEEVTDTAPKELTRAELRSKMRSEQLRLVRLRVTNLNPNKKDLPGEVFTVANRVLGKVSKFIPYGEQTENGYHVPYWIYQEMLERKFVNIKVRKNSKGQEVVETSDAREFALEVLPTLTRAELDQLATTQAAAGSID